MYMKQKYSRFSKWILRNIFGTDINVYKRELREHNHIPQKTGFKGVGKSRTIYYRVIYNTKEDSF